MQTVHYFVKPDDSELRLHVCRITPDAPPKFTVQIVHGIAERIGRYLPLMRHIAECGGAVIIHDLRGHGSSVPDFSALGCMNCSNSDLLNDIDAVYSTLNSPLADGETISPVLSDDNDGDDSGKYDVKPPRYLLGFSMGALIAGLYAARSSEELAGLILAGLPHREPFVSFGILGLDILCLLCGKNSKLTGLNNSAFNRYNKYFEAEPESDGKFLWLSVDIENRLRFERDPSCNRKSSTGTYRRLLMLLRDMYRPSSWNMDRTDLPIILLCGESDPVAGNEKWRRDSEKFLADMGYNNITVTTYPLRHEIFMDRGRETPFRDVTDFISRTIDDDIRRQTARRDEYCPQFDKGAENGNSPENTD